MSLGQRIYEAGCKCSNKCPYHYHGSDIVDETEQPQDRHRPCKCSEDDQCIFARERDEARAEVEQLQHDLTVRTMEEQTRLIAEQAEQIARLQAEITRIRRSNRRSILITAHTLHDCVSPHVGFWGNLCWLIGFRLWPFCRSAAVRTWVTRQWVMGRARRHEAAARMLLASGWYGGYAYVDGEPYTLKVYPGFLPNTGTVPVPNMADYEQLQAVLAAAQEYFTAYTDEINLSGESFSVYHAANKRKTEAWLRLRAAADAAGGNE